MVFLFNGTTKNILSNYIPHKTIICDSLEPPWINNRVKELINEKSDTFKCYLHRMLTFKESKVIILVIVIIIFQVEYLQNELKSLIEANKEKYYSRITKRMMNPLTSTKTYWSILKSFFYSKKIPCIPPLLHQNRYITKNKVKAELFNNVSAKQCFLMNISSVLPSALSNKQNMQSIPSISVWMTLRK